MRMLIGLLEIKHNPLWFFGGLCLVGALICYCMTCYSSVLVLGVNAWLKPLKFFLSVGIFSITMAIYLRYVFNLEAVNLYGWSMCILLGYELLCITFQAARGRRSHFNTESGLDSFIALTMGVAILIAMVHTCYIAYLFFCQQVFHIPVYLVLAIRLGLAGMAIFALEGLVTVGYLKHTVGAADGTQGLPLLNWSRNHGDLRVAHFFGMHALQFIPLCAYAFAHTKVLVWIIAIAYFTFVTFIFIQALHAKPFIK